jgi:hypothetical protein
MFSKSALVVAVSVAVVEAIDNGLARTPQMGWVSFPFQNICTKRRVLVKRLLTFMSE